MVAFLYHPTLTRAIYLKNNLIVQVIQTYVKKVKDPITHFKTKLIVIWKNKTLLFSNKIQYNIDITDILSSKIVQDLNSLWMS